MTDEKTPETKPFKLSKYQKIFGTLDEITLYATLGSKEGEYDYVSSRLEAPLHLKSRDYELDVEVFITASEYNDPDFLHFLATNTLL